MSPSPVRLLRSGFAAISWVLAAAWTWKALSVARNLRQVPDLSAPEQDRAPSGSPRLSVIVPACNEAASIVPSLRSLLAQTYAPLHIFAVDDRSTDATGRLIDEIATQHPDTVSAVHIQELPPGWLGKPHAMHTAAQQAVAMRADWLLFTDGDVLFHPDALRRALAFAETNHLDHLVLMPSPILRTRGEAMVMGFLQILGFWSLRPWRVADPDARDFIGIGAFNLLRTSAYQRTGGFAALRFQIVEDLALGRRVKQMRLRQDAIFAPGYVRLHWAPGVSGIVRTMTKNLFAICSYSVPLLAASSLALLILCLWPFAGLFGRRSRLPSAASLLAIGGLYTFAAPVTRMHGWTAIGFPLGALSLVFAMLRSAVITLRQGGVEWRGTVYLLDALRAEALPLAR